MKPLTITVLSLVLSAPLFAQAPRSTPASTDAEEASTTNETVFPASLAGGWRSRPFELSLTSDLHRSVYGPNARSVRVVQMTIRPSGEGVFTVTSSVRDARGRVVAGTTQIEEVRFMVGDVERPAGLQPRYATRVEHAERRYPDEATARFELAGAKLFLHPKDGAPGAVEVRFETPEGTGSFWETLQRTPARRAAR